jgi:hypothetical protein
MSATGSFLKCTSYEKCCRCFTYFDVVIQKEQTEKKSDSVVAIYRMKMRAEENSEISSVKCPRCEILGVGVVCLQCDVPPAGYLQR